MSNLQATTLILWNVSRMTSHEKNSCNAVSICRWRLISRVYSCRWVNTWLSGLYALGAQCSCCTLQLCVATCITYSYTIYEHNNWLLYSSVLVVNKWGYVESWKIGEYGTCTGLAWPKMNQWLHTYLFLVNSPLYFEPSGHVYTPCPWNSLSTNIPWG